MKPQLRNALLAVGLLLLIVVAESHTQTQMPRSVLGSGAVQSANATHRIAGTFGQPIIGTNKNQTNNAFLGFWYKKENIAVSVERIRGEHPTGFTLEEIYPNPILPSNEVVIGFSNPKRSQIRLLIIDNLGSVIFNLVDETLDEGRYSVRFTPTTLPSGTYFTVLQSGETRLVKKMLFVR